MKRCGADVLHVLGLKSQKQTKMRIAIGKKDDFAGSVYVYYIDENKHNYNTSYVTFELEYKKQ